MKITEYSEIGTEDVNALFPTLARDSHKGNMGRVICICGSYGTDSGMCGAAYFAALAAYRCGAGIVEIFTAKENYAPLAALVPEAVFTLWDGEGDNTEALLLSRMALADSVVLGCGLGQSDMAKKIVRCTLSGVDKPLVLDADALNIIASNPSFLSLMSDRQKEMTVITPHPAEMARLCGCTASKINADRIVSAQSLARRIGTVCLLKGHRTVITDGDEVYINRSGNAGMATAGMGDVLAGIIGALLARNSVDSCLVGRVGSNPTLYRAAVGAYIHGLAGDIAAEDKGQYSLMASDVVACIGQAIKGR